MTDAQISTAHALWSLGWDTKRIADRISVHENNPPDDATTHSFAKDQLKAIIERIEHVDGEIKELQEGKKEIFQEASSQGYDVKALRTIIRMRKQDANERAEQETILETYLSALGMI